ncbi:MAG: spermidine/putrescine ABC transporter substrate-binding protein [Treponema sp. CETP13]|nr:MAG: spermidine/putrescine ABC transporter substrate-binding protein [Treponema sp. CETP13]
MRKLSVLALGLCFLIVLAGCGKENTLYLYNWTYYTPDSVIEKFEQEFGVSVKVDSYASNEEMYAKLLAGASGYDIVFPSQDYTSIMIKEGMFKEIDWAQIPNGKYISDLVREKATYDPGFRYSVPYYMGTAGVIVNTKKVPDFKKSWSIFERKDLAGRMSLMDDMREVLGDSLAYHGFSVNSLNPEELAIAADTIENDWKPNIVRFDAEGYGKSFASGDFWVVQGYAECVYAEVPEENWDGIAFFVPEEGGPMYIDSMCILKNSKHYDLALEFMNFIHRPEIYAEFCDEFSFPSSVNTAAEKYMKVTPVYTAEDMLNCEIKDDLGEGLATYNEIWEDIRFSD